MLIFRLIFLLPLSGLLHFSSCVFKPPLPTLIGQYFCLWSCSLLPQRPHFLEPLHQLYCEQ